MIEIQHLVYIIQVMYAAWLRTIGIISSFNYKWTK